MIGEGRSELDEARKEVRQANERLEAAINSVAESLRRSTDDFAGVLEDIKAPLEFARNNPALIIAGLTAVGFFAGLVISRGSRRISSDRAKTPGLRAGPRLVGAELNPEVPLP